MEASIKKESKEKYTLQASTHTHIYVHTFNTHTPLKECMDVFHNLAERPHEASFKMSCYIEQILLRLTTQLHWFMQIEPLMYLAALVYWLKQLYTYP